MYLTCQLFNFSKSRLVSHQEVYCNRRMSFFVDYFTGDLGKSNVLIGGDIGGKIRDGVSHMNN